MISGKFNHCTTLEQFYAEIEALHRQAHGNGYTAHHKDLIELMSQCQSYKELGVNQGATAAAVMLQAPKYIELVDLVIDYFVPQRHLFEQFALANDVVLKVVQSSSIDPRLPVTEVDMLLVDTLHEPNHVVMELEKHAPATNKFIVIHDTGTFPAIHFAACTIMTKLGWVMKKWDTAGCGHTIFEKPNV